MDDFINDVLTWEDEVRKKKGAAESAQGQYMGAVSRLHSARERALARYASEGGTLADFHLRVQEARVKKIMDEDDGTFR